MRLACAGALLMALAGCSLVDQRTFHAPGGVPEAAVVPAGLPLVSVRMDGEDFRPALAEAVQAAQIRRPGATFDVVALVPTAAAPAEQDRRVAAAVGDAKAVAEAMGAAGIPAERLRLALRGDPGAPPREVRVFLR